MVGTDRRESIKLAIGAAILPFLSARPVLAQASAANAAEAISPPPGRMIYRRKLERALPGGLPKVVISRDFEIAFAPQADGSFLVSGQQSAVSVEVPPALAQLARFEEQRVERGLFPLVLDANGRISDWPSAAAGAEVASALDSVSERFKGDGSEIGTLIESLHSASSTLVSRLPNDLFAPAEPLREESRMIDLPWGDQGEVVTRFEAQRDPQTRLMRSARRLVITRYGGEERQNCENWELFPA